MDLMRREAYFVRFVEDDERTFVLLRRCVFEILDIGANNLPIGDEESLAICKKERQYMSFARGRSKSAKMNEPDHRSCRISSSPDPAAGPGT